MENVIGRIQTEADANGRRTDIHLTSSINAIKVNENVDLAELIESIGIGVTYSKKQPTHSALWIIPD